MVGELISAEELRRRLHYNPTTGVFTRVLATIGKREGSVAGTTRPDGYIQISIDRRFYPAHRLAWLYTKGVWPAHLVDHINGDRSDNRLANLRPATNSENLRNSRRNVRNKCGFKVVSRSRNGRRWLAFIRVDGVNTNLGTYDTAEQAHRIYFEAAQRHFGSFANAGGSL